jgi:RNA 2',3'-cyclic 3'-phosphodiesterase
VRLFVAVWPDPAAREAFAALPRPGVPSVRWSTPDQWHVTLRFLGDVADPDPVRDAFGRLLVSGGAPPSVMLGPATAWFSGRRVLQVPVAGLDVLAADVEAALARVSGLSGRDLPFSGHVTVARARGRSRGPVDLAGMPCRARWIVDEVTLVRSTLGGSGSRYEIIDTVPLASPRR